MFIIFSNDFHSDLLRLDLFRIKYDSQTLAHKEKRGCGWLGPFKEERPVERAEQVLQCRLKWGSALSSNPFGILLPEMACCPTQAIICEMLMNDPVKVNKNGNKKNSKPEVAIIRNLSDPT